MIAAIENLALPVKLYPIDIQDASIPWWLNEKSDYPVTQSMKTGVLSSLAAGSYDTQTRIDIGDHVSTPLEVHLQLAADENVDVRFALAENHNVHERVLSLLAEDSHPYVAHRAQKTLARLKAGVANIVHWVQDVAPIVSIKRFASPKTLGSKLKQLVI
jgi:hypothetical protein